jgi:hypothetical protein
MLTLLLYKNDSGHVRTAGPWYGAFCSNLLQHPTQMGDLLLRRRLLSMYNVKFLGNQKMAGAKGAATRAIYRAALLFLLRES